MRPTADSDWLNDDGVEYGVGDDDATATTERPPGPQFWRCDGEDFEPAAFPTLTEATGEKPATPEAIIAGGGELLAESAEDICQWAFTAAGLRRLDQERAEMAARDTDTALSVILAVDFSLDISRAS